MIDIDTLEIPDEIIESGPTAVERYLEWCFKQDRAPDGDFERDLAFMFARKRGPGSSGTEQANFRGASANPFPNMNEQIRQHYIKQANQQGVSFTGKVYKSALVRPEFKGRFDPQALVSDTSECVARLKERGWSSDGTIAYQAPEREVNDRLNDDDYQVSDDIVNEHVACEVIENHGGRIKKRDYRDLRAKVKNRLQGAM